MRELCERRHVSIWLQVEDDIERIRNVSNQQELMSSFRDFGQTMVEATERAGRRQEDLKDSRRRDEIAAARATLKRSAPILLTSSKVSAVCYCEQLAVADAEPRKTMANEVFAYCVF